MSTQWTNIEHDPGALHALVASITEHVPAALIDYVWIFPARRIALGESTVIVVGAFDDDAERRRVITAHFTVSRNRRGIARVTARFDEHGAAPSAAVPRIVAGVLRRLGEDTEASPREVQIEGSPEQWDALIVELGGELPAAEPPETGEPERRDPPTTDEAGNPAGPA